MIFAEEEVPLSKLKHGWYTFCIQKVHTVYTTLLWCIYLVYLKHTSEKIPYCPTTSDVYYLYRSLVFKAMMYSLCMQLYWTPVT